MKKLRAPKFNSENQERRFWWKVDLSKHFKPSDFESASFPNLKPSSQSISLRLLTYLLVRIKGQANELCVPYQSLSKRYVAQGALKKSYISLLVTRLCQGCGG